MLRKYILNILMAADEFVNTLAGGSPHESISSRVGRNYPGTWVAKAIDTLFFWQHNHCETHIEPKVYEKDALIK